MSLFSRKSRPDARVRSIHRARVQQLEGLEDRRVPATFTVNTLADTVDGNPSVTSLREAITKANSQDDDDEIRFSVTGTINLTGALPDLSGNLRIQGPGATGLTVRRGTGGDYRIFSVSYEATVVLDGLTISNGFVLGGEGGGIANHGTLTVSNSTLSGNSAYSGYDVDAFGNPDHVGGAGGGIYNFYSGTLTVSNSTLSGNSASGDSPFCNGGAISNGGTLTVSGSTLSGNSSYFGGGISNGGTLEVSGSTLSGNSASSNGGGGIYNSNGVVTVSGSTLSGNSANFGGGGIYNNSGGELVIRNSTLSGNSAYGFFGGGIYNYGTVAVSGCTFSNNSAGNSGGGLYNIYGAVTVSNSTFSGNSALNFGGGICDASYSQSAGTMTVSNSTLTGNSASEGGGIANSETMMLNNSIVANSESGGDIVNFGVLAGSQNLIEDGSGGLPDTITGDPNLGELADNGGPTLTHALLPGSPAIDAGDDALAVDPSTGLPLTTDQRGLPYGRINGPRVDLGALESPGPAVVDTVITGTNGNDLILLLPTGRAGEVRAHVNGVLVGTFRPTGKLIVRGLGGNDVISALGCDVPAMLFGDAGNDALIGGGGGNVLVGGDGNDMLTGFGGRDLLIGGAGSDLLAGGTGDDLLVAGATAFDADVASLAAIMAEWTSDRSYDKRVANLRGTGTGSSFANRLNGNAFLHSTANATGPATAFNDTAVDILIGEGGRDWFFANRTGRGPLDLLPDGGGNENLDDLS